jgi:hypothetical protein
MISWKKKNHIGEFLIVLGMLVYVLLPARVLAYGIFDGGMLEGVDSQCSCSGGQTIRVTSDVDYSSHVYMYQPGATQLFMNYNIESAGGNFLTTLIPFAICLDASEECEGSSGQMPEGIFFLTGTSFLDKNKFLAFLNQLPGAETVRPVISNVWSDISWKDYRL